MARRLRQTAGDDQMPVHDALVRMVRRWEREGLRTERYELLYAAALGVEPEQLSSAPSGDEPATGEAPAQFRPVDEALDLGGWLEQTNAGPGTIAYIAATARRLAGDYTRRPPLTVLAEAVELQRRITGLLRGGRQRLAQTRDLCRASAEVFALLTLLCSDIGQYPAADAYGHAGSICADEAASDMASALVLSARAKASQWEHRYAGAAEIARRGYELCPPAGARVLLACQEANAAQALGDCTRAREALSRAQSAQDSEIPAPDDDGTTAWSCPPPRQANYAAIVNMGCGDLDRSLQEVQRADRAWAGGGPWVYGTWAQVRIGAAIARARKREVDGAAEEIAPVLSIAPEYRVVTITGRLGDVDQLLHEHQFQGSRDAADLSERIGAFRAASLGVKEITGTGVL